MLDGDFMVDEGGDRLDFLLGIGQEVGHACIERQFAPQVAQLGVAEPGQRTFCDVGEEMVEVEGLLGHGQPGPAVEGAQRLDFLPEPGGVDVVFAEQGHLLVPGDERLIEVPDDRDDVSGE